MDMKRLVKQIAYTPPCETIRLSPLQRSFIPLLYISSSLYRVALFVRHQLYNLGFFHKHRLPVVVVSVGNLSWGGNGKTPMVEFLALWFTKAGISPLILTRGYAGGDEAKMLKRHLSATSAKIGVGANRAAIAACFFEKYGYEDSYVSSCLKRLCVNHEQGLISETEEIGVVILDDGMQHLSLFRDLDIVMINGITPWGNNKLLPLGPLREPLAALRRADIAVIHHADLVSVKDPGKYDIPTFEEKMNPDAFVDLVKISDWDLKLIELKIREVNETLPIFLTRLAPSGFFKVENCYSKFPLLIMQNMVALCVSAIGSANAFVQSIEKLGPLHVDRLDFSDHHSFQAKDIEIIRQRLKELHDQFSVKPVVVVTEKDYDRDPAILRELSPFEVLVLCSHLQIIPKMEHAEKSFKKFLKQFLEIKHSKRIQTHIQRESEVE